ncbi:DnaJ family domain-containing protein [uncultured Thiohalocapsa sp.]|uniref:DnaJ family domain-containing protein n=1 Tax=uncultured Thiohalocapsa sp. TaxID=768990 RepID=UPI0025E770A3|nr:DnaJ family domain-containing protein [uncultured Thiohalocapsa sp.]
MWLIDALAEKKIQEAIERGELDALPGAGRPVPEDDLSMVPEHLRAGYRLLKSAGFLPPELHGAAQLKDIEDLPRRIQDPHYYGDGNLNRLGGPSLGYGLWLPSPFFGAGVLRIVKTIAHCGKLRAASV